MEDRSRQINRKKVFSGVFFVCLAVVLMLGTRESHTPFVQMVWVLLLGLGLILYLWGRFFSRDAE